MFESRFWPFGCLPQIHKNCGFADSVFFVLFVRSEVIWISGSEIHLLLNALVHAFGTGRLPHLLVIFLGAFGMNRSLKFDTHLLHFVSYRNSVFS